MSEGVAPGTLKWIRNPWLVVVILVTLIFISPVVSIEHRMQAPHLEVFQTDSIEGTLGCSVENRPATPVRNLTLYNNTILDRSIEWNRRWYEGNCRAYESPEGVILELKTDDYSGPHITYDAYLSIPVVNYTDITCGTSFRVMKGNVSFQFGMYFDVWPDTDTRDGDSVVIQAAEGEDYEISLTPEIESLHNLTSGWIARVSFDLTITASTPSTLIVGNVLVSVASLQDLYPISFDIQDSQGESLFQNPNINSIGGENRHWHGEHNLYPAFHLTTIGDYTYSASGYVPRTTNETLYLPAGNYTGYAGWLVGTLMPEWLRTACSFTVSENQGAAIAARIPVCKLFVTMFPEFPYTLISIQGYSKACVSSNTDFLYLYPETRGQLYIEPVGYHRFGGHSDSSQYTNPLQLGKISLENIDSNTTLTILVVYSHLTIGPFVLDYGQILWLVSAGLLCLYVVILKRCLFRQPSFVRSVLPLVPLLASAILPWAHYEFAEGTNVVEGAVFLPITTTIWTGENGVSAFAPSSYMVPNVFLPLVIFWLPVVALIYMPLVKGGIDNLSTIRQAGILVPAFIMLSPVLLAVCYLYVISIAGLEFGWGLVAVFAYPPVFLIAVYWPGRRVTENQAVSQ